ncbi:MAG TPA: ECF-type sigma factor [Gemmatimonadales bacterium]|nr:ECF-type sigma factor [Gemmatimonadales bacterium]
MSEQPLGPPAPEKLLQELYSELRALAAHHLRGERAGHTLVPTALVHEVYLRMQGKPGLLIEGRNHFMAVASIAMRRVLVDHARTRSAQKRGGGVTHVTVGEANAITSDRTQDVLLVDGALERLAQVDPQAARIVEMRFFAGMTELEIASVLGKSDRWVRNHWAFARAWLRRELGDLDGAERDGS